MDRNTLKSALAATPDCLSAERLAELSPDEARAHQHISQCARCQTELALLREFESSEPLHGEGAAVAWISTQLDRRLDEIKNSAQIGKRKKTESTPEQSAWLRRLFSLSGFRAMASITAAVVIVAGGLFIFRSPKEPALDANLGSGPAIYRSREVQTIAPQGELAKVPKNLQWKPVQGAATYKIVITEVDRTEIWSAQTGDTLVTIPNSVVAKIRVGKPFLWQVTALDPQGVVLASSQAQRFVVIPGQNRD